MTSPRIRKTYGLIQGTARNLIILFSKPSSARRVQFGDSGDSFSDPIGELEAAERRRLVGEELRSYSVLDQQILLFSLVDGHSLRRSPSGLKMSHEAVRARKSRLVRR